MKALVSEAGQSPRSDNTLYIPLKINVMGDDAGNGYYPTSKVLEALCQLNEDFAPYGFHFYVEGAFNFIDHSAFYQMPDGYAFSPAMDEFIADNNTLDVLNIYITHRTSINGGFSFAHWPGYDTLDIGFPSAANFPQDHAVVVRKAHLNNSPHLLVHEVGHYFALWHTFFGWEGLAFEDFGPTAPDTLQIEWNWQDSLYVIPVLVDRVDGWNCENTGDFICDTPPDYLSRGHTCNSDLQSEIIQVDPTGQEFRTDSRNYMSYSFDECQNQFSSIQVDIMRYYAEETRDYLLYNQNPPQPLSDISFEMVYPPDGAVFSDLEVTLEWDMPDATLFELTFGTIIGTSFISIEKVNYLEDSNYTVDVTFNRKYFWIVRGFSSYYPCDIFSDTSYFEVEPPVNTVDIELDPMVQFFPNPIKDQVQFKSTNTDSWWIDIRNITGQLMHQQLIQDQGQIDCEDFPDGIYLITCQQGGRRITRRVVKQGR